jgi:hypothetical protein
MRVFVLDHESSDATATIAREHGAQVVIRPFPGFVEARRFALSQVQTPWTLMIDADEALDSELRDAIVAANDAVDGYMLQRSTYYCGRPLRMWRGERLLRLFRTDAVRLEAAPAAGGNAQLHERWICDGTVAQLPGTLHHYSYPTREAYREKYERYTAVEASGVVASPARVVLESLRAPARFMWYAVVRAAVFDGIDGLRVAWASAWYPVVVYRKALRRGR